MEARLLQNYILSPEPVEPIDPGKFREKRPIANCSERGCAREVGSRGFGQAPFYAGSVSHSNKQVLHPLLHESHGFAPLMPCAYAATLQKKNALWLP